MARNHLLQPSEKLVQGLPKGGKGLSDDKKSDLADCRDCVDSPSSPGLRFLHQTALDLLPLLLEPLPVVLQHLLLLPQPLLFLAGFRKSHNNEETKVSRSATCIPEAMLQCHSRKRPHSPFRHQSPGSRGPGKITF